MTHLTPYDTGARLEPKPWSVRPLDHTTTGGADRYGKVDFDNDEGATLLTVHVDRNVGRDGHTLHVTNVATELNVRDDGTTFLLDVPSESLREKVDQALRGLRTPIEREEAEIYWGDSQAMVLVPGEKHVRKQQLIMVSESGPDMSAVVKSWGSGNRDTRIG